MNEEEKETIKYFYNLRATIDESNMLFDEDINVKCGKETIKKITIILNLLEKKDKIIDLMTNYICSKCFDDITNRLKDDDIAYWGIEGSIKQYFKEKVENGN